MSEWPRSLFDAPALRGLDERGQKEVVRAGHFRRIEAGATLYAPGDPSDAFFVVHKGRVRLTAVRRGDELESELREARSLDTLGEEAALPGALRAARAVALEDSELAEIPMGVLKRSLAKAGGGELLEREERSLRRAASRDVLGTLAFARDLPRDDFELLLDGVRWRSLPRRARLYKLGDPADLAYLVVSGLVQLQTEHEGRVQVRAYVTRGDLFGDEEALAGRRRGVHAVALGDCQLLSVPRALLRSLVDRNPRVLERIRRVESERQELQAEVARGAVRSTEHVFHDLYRMQMARSLLAIDQDRCVRCGHCAWTCAETHAGVARLVRRGDKIVTELAVVNDGAKSLLLPSSCQHCHNPACMIDCPTGAIGRDPEGDVFIREALCTGCGACAKACPWDNIRMAPRSEGAGSVDVAVKCDLCKELAQPACVSACPTEAILRLDPQRDFAEVRALFGGEPGVGERPSRRASLVEALPQVALALCLGLTPAGILWHARDALVPGRGLAYAAGILALVSCVALGLYVVPKRFGHRFLRRRAERPRGRLATPSPSEPTPRSALAPHYRVHVAVGLLVLALVALHSGGRVGHGVTAALTLVFWVSAGLGALGALAYRVLPPVLSRLEPKGALPEDLALERELLFDRLHRATSGTSDLVKSIAERLLVPYARATSGPLALTLSGRSLAEERKELRARVDRVLEGRGAGKLDGLDALVRVVVELRALPARRALTFALRAVVPLHVVGTVALLVLVLLHAFQMTRW